MLLSEVINKDPIYQRSLSEADSISYNLLILCRNLIRDANVTPDDKFLINKLIQLFDFYLTTASLYSNSSDAQELSIYNKRLQKIQQLYIQIQSNRD